VVELAPAVESSGTKKPVIDWFFCSGRVSKTPYMNRTIVIGSSNPTKVESLEVVLGQLNVESGIISWEAPSKIADQPRGMKTALNGARNRIAASKIKYPIADAYVAIEGTIIHDRHVDTYFNVACIILCSKAGKEYVAYSSQFALTSEEVNLIDQGYNLSDVSGMLYGTVDIGKTYGFCWVKSNKLVPRIDYNHQPLTYVLSAYLRDNAS
jgi:inosine/xanthosine triphosphatase